MTSNLMSQTATPPASGDGTVGNPYQIATLDNLYWLTQNELEWDKNYIQVANIDATNTSSWNTGDHDNNSGTADAPMGFTPLGYSGSMGSGVSFTGTYNGKGYHVANLLINRPGVNYNDVGFFGYIESAVIDSLSIINAQVSGGQYNVGILTGSSVSGSTIRYCHSSGSVEGLWNFVGGIVGHDYSLEISNCYNEASVSGGGAVGGLIGGSYTADVSNCYSTGAVQGTDPYVGGLIGNHQSSSSISNSYSIGNVQGVGGVGGLTGWSSGTVTNCFWDTQTSGQITSASGTGQTSTQMQDLSTFTSNSWDFSDETANGTNDYWSMPCGGDNYPKLSWQNVNFTGISDLTTSISGTNITANNTSASYVWLNCDNNYSVIAGETGQSFTASQNGNYAVELTENGCVDTTSCLSITTVGIIENSFGNNLLVYPNPTSGSFSIDLGATYENSLILITDISGKLIDSKNITQSKTLSLSIEEPAGIYFISIQTGDKKAVIRLIKE